MKEIKLTRNKVALVDDWNYEWLNQFKWQAIPSKTGTTFYVIRSSYKLMHREIMKTPVGLVVDHKDRNGLNCQEYNMRNCTNQQNLWNSKKRLGTSKYKGVHYIGNKSGWQASFKNGKERIVLGNFKFEVEAAEAYNTAVLQIRGEFAVLNVIYQEDRENYLKEKALQIEKIAEPKFTYKSPFEELIALGKGASWESIFKT